MRHFPVHNHASVKYHSLHNTPVVKHNEKLGRPGKWMSCLTDHPLSLTRCPSNSISTGTVYHKCKHHGEFLNAVCMCRVTHDMHGVWKTAHILRTGNNWLSKRTHILIRGKPNTCCKVGSWTTTAILAWMEGLVKWFTCFQSWELAWKKLADGGRELRPDSWAEYGNCLGSRLITIHPLWAGFQWDRACK